MKLNLVGCALFFISMMVWVASGMLDIVHHDRPSWIIFDVIGVCISLWGYLYFKQQLAEENKS